MRTDLGELILKFANAAEEERVYPHTTEPSDKYPSFAIRVQLSNAASYDDLHEIMEKHGFHRAIRDRNGTLKDLPTAMYSYIAKTEYLSCETVCDKAKDAVNEHLDSTNQKDAGVELFVSNLTGAWFVLNEAKEEGND
ncbi:hypothetical protein [Pseudomonas congelans]|uniref:hypothetical protein n=1 Tax=Pseudomonas congelans TaxID=200452 RepID=UPI000944E203|nr:hypothetical protein [Pseudomonas congelans]PBP99399.1 hypothetical protein CCL24_05785 [Pseudomonas congelans]